MTPLEWLQRPSKAIRLGIEGYNPAALKWTNGETLAFLYLKNKCSGEIAEWGVFDGWYGLTPDDALLFIHYTSFLRGVCDATGISYQETVGIPLLAYASMLIEKMKISVGVGDLPLTGPLPALGET